MAVPEGRALTDLTGGTFVYTGGDGREVRLSHTCTVGEEQPKVEELTVTKTAVTSYHRSHAWSLAKSVDKSLVKLSIDGAGDTAVNYAVDVNYDGYTDSGWNVSGTVTIENTGDLDATYTVADTMTLEGDDYLVTLTCADVDDVLAVGERTTCTYSEDIAGAFNGENNVVVSTLIRDYGASADVTFGDPASESDKTVSLSDTGDLLGAQDGGTFTAPNGGSFTYSADLAYADYGQAQCGTHEYGNTATLTGDDGVLDTADANVTVKVQCWVLGGSETAWGQGTTYPKQNSWAMFTAYAPGTVDLMAGQHHDAGDITFSEMTDGKVTITIRLDGWGLRDVKEGVKIQGYAKAPSGKVSPGQFTTYKGNDLVVTVDAFNFYGIHLDVAKWIADPKF